MSWRGRALAAGVLLGLVAGCSADAAHEPRARDGRAQAGTAAGAPFARIGACPDLPRAEPVDGGLPALTLPCLGRGPDVRLSDLRGVPTVLNVWAAWCINCDREMPLFAAAQKGYGERVRFLGIHYKATREQALASQQDFGVPFPSVHDADGDRVARRLRVTGPPQTFFVDPDGKVVGRKIGEITSVRELMALVEEHLGVPK